MHLANKLNVSIITPCPAPRVGICPLKNIFELGKKNPKCGRYIREALKNKGKNTLCFFNICLCFVYGLK